MNRREVFKAGACLLLPSSDRVISNGEMIRKIQSHECWVSFYWPTVEHLTIWPNPKHLNPCVKLDVEGTVLSYRHWDDGGRWKRDADGHLVRNEHGTPITIPEVEPHWVLHDGDTVDLADPTIKLIYFGFLGVDYTSKPYQRKQEYYIREGQGWKLL